MFRAFHEKRDEAGFTLIELLVVILIIAILAAIAIPVFLNQRKKGWISQSQSALKNAATAAESYATTTNGSYATLTGASGVAALNAEGFKKASDVTIAVAGTATSYCLTATHASLSGDAWGTSTYDSNDGEPTSADTC